MQIFLDILTYIGYIIVALLCLMFMIVVHETGHYLAGRWLGFSIEEFSIGFGPAIFKHKSKKSGQTFAIRWIPIGGYCAFYGEEEDEEKKRARETREREEAEERARLTAENDIYGEGTAVIDNGAIAEDNAVTTVDKARKIPFNEQAPWKRIIVFIAGALFNFISAIMIVSIFFMAYGEYTPTVTNVYDVGTGIEQHFEVGDEIIKVNGKYLYTSVYIDDLNRHLAGAGDHPTITVRRNGELVDITVNKGVFTPLDENGEAIRDDAGNVITKEGFGIVIGQYGRYKFGFFEAIGRSFVFCFKVVGMIFSIFGQLFTGAIGIKGTLGGPVTTITTIAALTRVGFDAVLYAICTMSATLGVMNLLPLPALDGSKVVFTLIEWVRGKPINRKVENTIHLVGLCLLFAMTIIFDIINFI